MKKALKIVLIAVAVLIILVIVGFVSVTGTSTKTAYLKIDSGAVEVDTGSGWRAAEDGMDLSLNDKVRTADGEASVILYESIIIQLEKNTEISIRDLAKDNVAVKQESGTTWNKFTGLSGVKEYEVETPTTVATVRGTEFGVNLSEVIVGEGEVDVESEGQKLRILEGKKAALLAGMLTELDLTPEEKQFIIKRLAKNLQILKDLRMAQLQKHGFLLNKIKKMRNLTDEDIMKGFEKFDSSNLTEEEVMGNTTIMLQKLPFVKKSLDNIIGLNKKIRKQNQLIQKLMGGQ
jgi:hypothetical protein